MEGSGLQKYLFQILDALILIRANSDKVRGMIPGHGPRGGVPGRGIGSGTGGVQPQVYGMQPYSNWFCGKAPHFAPHHAICLS